jgi:prephenate dehydrogenase
MTAQISIIGLGQIGASIGLALANQANLLRRTGHDRDQNTARKAEKLGAIDRVVLNLGAAAKDADLVLICLPMDQIREALEGIAGTLKEGAVVMDTGPVKEVVAAWAGELLPPGRHYIGLTPVLNPAYLHEAAYGIEAAHADLFKGGLIGITAPPRASSEALKLAADLSSLLGARAFFADPLEMDGLMAATHLLPQLLSAALLNTTVDRPGWREARKVAGRAYAEVTAPLEQLSEPAALVAALTLNRENMLRLADGALEALQALRDDLADQEGKALEEQLTRAFRGRVFWWDQRQKGDFPGDGEPAESDELPSSADVWGRWFGMGRKPGKKK